MSPVLSLEEQIRALEREYDGACADTAADQGEAVVDGGGWVELARAVADLAGPEISEEARREFLRMQGLGPAR